jgi:capsular polysaccharide transport system ATP-binding protein
VDVKQVSDYVLWFSELADYFDAPVKFYSSGMLAKLAFGLCLSIDFDVYLIDEITEVGDGIFREKASLAFQERAQRSDIILVSHNIDTIREYCDVGAVINAGKVDMYSSVSDAVIAYREATGMASAH